MDGLVLAVELSYCFDGSPWTQDIAHHHCILQDK